MDESQRILRELLLDGVIPALDAMDFEEPVKQYVKLKKSGASRSEILEFEKTLMERYMIPRVKALADRLNEMEDSAEDEVSAASAFEMSVDINGLLSLLKATLDEKEFEEEGYDLICVTDNCIELIQMSILPLYIDILTFDPEDIAPGNMRDAEVVSLAMDIIRDFWRVAANLSVNLDLSSDKFCDEE